jgi:hypothetical protein
MQRFLLSRHLSDLIAALLQLLHSPRKIAQPLDSAKLLSEQNIWQDHLHTLVTQAHAVMVMETLMGLVGDAEQPKWMERAVAQLVHAALMRQGKIQ